MIDGEFSSKILTYLESSGKTFVELLNTEVQSRCAFAFKRQLMNDREKKAGILRMSSGGQCSRKQWYSYRGEEGEALSGRTIITFLNGDLLEVALSIVGRLAGLNLLGKPSGEDGLIIKVPRFPHRGEPEDEPYIVRGHLDDLLQDKDGELYVVEYKTMSEYGYREFEKNGLNDDWGYFTQASLYCHALNIKKFILVAACKNTGHICDHIYNANESLVEAAIDRWSRIINVDEMPGRAYDPEAETVYNRKTKEYDPTGRLILPIQCSYCDYKKSCWPNVQVDSTKSKPIFVVTDEQEMKL